MNVNRMWVQAHLVCYVEAEHEGQDEHAASAVPHDSDQIPKDLQLEVIKAVLSHHILQHCLRPCVQVFLHILYPASRCTVVNADGQSLFAQGMDTKIGTHHPPPPFPLGPPASSLSSDDGVCPLIAFGHSCTLQAFQELWSSGPSGNL